MKNRGLGKGLSALLGEEFSLENKNTSEVITEVYENFKEIDISQIQTSATQPRFKFDQGSLNELAASIKEKGVLQPIIVKPCDNGRFEIIAGERRYRACSLAGLKTIPAIIKDLSEQEISEVALIENVQRENLNPMEEAYAYEKLIKKYNYTHEALAVVIGKSRSYITNALRLISLPEKVKNYLFEGQLSVGHARSLINQEQAESLAEEIITNALSVREVEKLVSGGDNKPAKSRNYESSSYNELTSLEEAISKEFGTKVQIKLGKYNNGQIVIHFKDLEIFDAIIQKLGG